MLSPGLGGCTPRREIWAARMPLRSVPAVDRPPNQRAAPPACGPLRHALELGQASPYRLRHPPTQLLLIVQFTARWTAAAALAQSGPERRRHRPINTDCVEELANAPEDSLLRPNEELRGWKMPEITASNAIQSTTAKPASSPNCSTQQIYRAERLSLANNDSRYLGRIRIVVNNRR
jgi:hypothetical protein